MEIALQEAKNGINAGHGGPFGCVVVKNGEIVERGHNEVIRRNDPTCHGEVMAIRDACRENGNPLPEFDISADDVTIVFPANNVAVEQNEPLNEPLKSILEVIRKNPYFSKEVIATETGKSRATITRALSKLQNDGIIKRVGSDKTGHWEIISQDEDSK